MWAVSKISSRYLCIGRHTCHRRMYILFIVLSAMFSDVSSFFVDIYVQFLGFSVLQWNFLSKVSSFGQFAIKNDPPIHIWSTYVVSDRYFHYVYYQSFMDLRVVSCSPFLSLFLKAFISWLWTSTVTAPWLRKVHLSIFLTELSKFKKSICKSDIDNNFW